jgi:hypothetical protein
MSHAHKAMKHEEQAILHSAASVSSQGVVDEMQGWESHRF